MRTLAFALLSLLVVAVGVTTHLGAGGSISLDPVPGLSGTLTFPWIEEKTTGPLYPEAAAAEPGSGASTDGDGSGDAPSPPDAAPAQTAAATETPVANDPGPLTAPAAETGRADTGDVSILGVPGIDGARAPGADGTSPRFAFPVRCRPGVDCMVQSFVDTAPGDAFRDHTCGALSYDGHRGTDIRLPSYVEMEAGYAVVAAAPGRVSAVRDGMPDANYRLFGREAVTDRGLGNVVAVDHGAGWITYYGHMRRGSIGVAVGDLVAPGQRLGRIGLSGLTEFPHLHFQIMRDGEVVDPYTGQGMEGGCGVEGESLWAEAARTAAAYPRTLLLRLGFSHQVLNKAAVEYMLFRKESVDAADRALILHAYLTGLLEGDRAEVRIFGPGGETFARADVEIDEAAQARILRVGKKDLDNPPSAGRYRGVLRYYRAGSDGPQPLFESEVAITVE